MEVWAGGGGKIHKIILFARLSQMSRDESVFFSPIAVTNLRVKAFLI